MLCDDLAAVTADQVGPLAKGFEAIGQLLRPAMKFVFDDDAITLAERVGWSGPRSLKATLPLVRLPASVVWIEIPESARRAARAAGFPNVPVLKLGQSLPRRTGFLCRALDASMLSFEVFVCMSWAAHVPDVMFASVNFDLGRAPKPPRDPAAMRSKVATEVRRHPHAPLLRAAHKNADELAALFDLAGVADIQIASIWSPHLRAIVREIGEDETVGYVRKSADEIRNDVPTIVASLALLNSRNLVDAVPSDLDALNRARQRKGRVPFFSHHTVRLSLSQVQRQRLASQGIGDDAAMRAHMVRGHFKARRSGIFWWMPHVRGDAVHGSVGKDYRVTA